MDFTQVLSSNFHGTIIGVILRPRCNTCAATAYNIMPHYTMSKTAKKIQFQIWLVVRLSQRQKSRFFEIFSSLRVSFAGDPHSKLFRKNVDISLWGKQGIVLPNWTFSSLCIIRLNWTFSSLCIIRLVLFFVS